MKTATENQWIAPAMHRYMAALVQAELGRRLEVNSGMNGAVKLSIRPEAILRDISRHWLNVAVPAGNC